jgi:hypothetical protein
MFVHVTQQTTMYSDSRGTAQVALFGSALNARLPFNARVLFNVRLLLNNLFQPNYKLYLLCRYLRYRNYRIILLILKKRPIQKGSLGLSPERAIQDLKDSEEEATRWPVGFT